MRLIGRVTLGVMIGLALLAVGWLVVGCYPHNGPVPTCAEDPSQDWCVPPAFVAARDGGEAGCRRVRSRPGTVAMACDDHEPVVDGVDQVVDASGRTWSACAWNSCGRDPNCRARLFRHDGGAR